MKWQVLGLPVRVLRRKPWILGLSQQTGDCRNWPDWVARAGGFELGDHGLILIYPDEFCRNPHICKRWAAKELTSTCQACSLSASGFFRGPSKIINSEWEIKRRTHQHDNAYC